MNGKPSESFYFLVPFRWNSTFQFHSNCSHEITKIKFLLCFFQLPWEIPQIFQFVTKTDFCCSRQNPNPGHDLRGGRDLSRSVCWSYWEDWFLTRLWIWLINMELISFHQQSWKFWPGSGGAVQDRTQEVPGALQVSGVLRSRSGGLDQNVLDRSRHGQNNRDLFHLHKKESSGDDHEIQSFSERTSCLKSFLLELPVPEGRSRSYLWPWRNRFVFWLFSSSPF